MIFPQKGEGDRTLGPSSNPPVWLPVILPVNTLGTLDIKLLTVLTGTPVPSSCIISTMRSICQLKKFVNVLLSYKWQNWINIYFLYIFNLFCISIFKRSLKCTCEVDIWIAFIEYNCRNVVFTTTTTFSKKKIKEWILVICTQYKFAFKLQSFRNHVTAGLRLSLSSKQQNR